MLGEEGTAGVSFAWVGSTDAISVSTDFCSEAAVELTSGTSAMALGFGEISEAVSSLRSLVDGQAGIVGSLASNGGLGSSSGPGFLLERESK